MPFRPKTARDIQWEKWMAANQGAMLDAGIPITVAEDKKALLYFLEHGYYSPIGSAEPLIDVDHLPQAVAVRLCNFLEKPDFIYPESDAVRRLRSLLRRTELNQRRT